MWKIDPHRIRILLKAKEIGVVQHVEVPPDQPCPCPAIVVEFVWVGVSQKFDFAEFVTFGRN